MHAGLTEDSRLALPRLPATTNGSNLSTINISQADDSLGYSMLSYPSQPSDLEKLPPSSKDNFSKPYPPKPEMKKGEMTHSSNSRMSHSEASDNHVKSTSDDVHNIKESDNNYESIEKHGTPQNDILPTIPNQANDCTKAEDIHSMTQLSKKMSKLEKKVSNDKVRPYFNLKDTHS